jgi:hypothetical protein
LLDPSFSKKSSCEPACPVILVSIGSLAALAFTLCRTT